MSQAEVKLSNIAEYNVLPLKDMVFFPHMVVPLIVGRKESIGAVDASLGQDSLIFLTAQREAYKDVVTVRDLYRIGVVGRILQVVQLPNNLIKILVEGIQRGKVVTFRKKDKMFNAKVELLHDMVKPSLEAEAERRQLMSLFKDYAKLNEDIPEEILFSLNQIEGLAKLTDFIATYVELDVVSKQKLLDEYIISKRVKLIVRVLSREKKVLNYKSELESKVRDQMLRSQRTVFLQEQMRVIQEELGEEEYSNGDVLSYRKKLSETKLSVLALEKVQEEIQRLAKIQPLSPEYSVITNYLDWVLTLPWEKRSTDQTDIKNAQRILDEDHYGLKNVKKRIIEYIAVLSRVKKMQGPVLCLVGAPGVGKTSLAKSVARALNREFIRISLGGVRDEAEIRGHRKTYIGSMPGKIIQGMKRAATTNPVFLLDEVDKMGGDYKGDPSSALLEVLDPEQNNAFVDHYIEVDYDLSDVLFIVTANNPSDIPEALYDRLEVIELSGYLDFEKLEIAIRHLVPRQKKFHGLEENELLIDREVLKKIIMNYTMEAGVRELERQISKICRAAVVQINSKKLTQIHVSTANMIRLVGQPKYLLNDLKGASETGVAQGLAWTPYGGDMLRIEVNLLPGKDKLTLTGKLGEVMQESALIAMAYIRSRYRKFGIPKDFNEKHEVHIHIPEGAVPKEGPSAGITLITALLSALKNKPVPRELAMTGEVTLRGKVLAIGGLNEKLLAAGRHGIKQVVIPAENKSDLAELDKELYKDLKITFIKDYDQLYKMLFPSTEQTLEK